MSDIGAMVELLIASGCTPGVAAQVVAQAFTAGAASGGHRAEKVDATADRRRQWDRERKRQIRGERLRLPEAEWLPLVSKILKRDGHKCSYCGATERLTADHVVPLSRGGTNAEENLTACCLPCNASKGAKLVAEWRVDSGGFHRNPITDPLSTSTTNSLSVEREGGALQAVHPTKRKRGSRLSDDWQLDDVDIEYAVSKGIPRSKVPLVGEAFSNHHRAKGTVFADWRAAWRKWCGNEIKFHGGMNGTAQVRSDKSLTDNIRRELAELEGSESADLALSARPVLLISR